MATRFYFRENAAAAVSPTVESGWSYTDGNFLRRKMLRSTSGADTIATYTTNTEVNQAGAFRQYVSDELAAGNVFDNTVTHLCVIAVSQTNLGYNMQASGAIKIVSSDGSTTRHVVIAHVTTGPTEFATTSGVGWESRRFFNGSGAGSYTTVAGDRLVIELGHVNIGGIDGPATSGEWRLGSSAATDLADAENDTDNENPWYQTSLNIVFASDIIGSGGVIFDQPTLALSGAVSIISVSGEGAIFAEPAIAAVGVVSSDVSDSCDWLFSSSSRARIYPCGC